MASYPKELWISLAVQFHLIHCTLPGFRRRTPPFSPLQVAPICQLPRRACWTRGWDDACGRADVGRRPHPSPSRGFACRSWRRARRCNKALCQPHRRRSAEVFLERKTQYTGNGSGVVRRHRNGRDFAGSTRYSQGGFTSIPKIWTHLNTFAVQIFEKRK